MSHSSIQQQYSQSPQIGKLLNTIANSENSGIKNIQLKGLVGSSLSFVLANVFKNSDRPFLAIFNDKEEAAYYLNDLERLIGEDDVLFYPGSYRRPYQIEETDNANVLLRAEVLNKLNTKNKEPSTTISILGLNKQCPNKSDLTR